MPSVARSMLCLLSFVLGNGLALYAQEQSGHIYPGARVVIAPMGGFETYFAAAIREKQVPIALTLDRDSAQYFVVSTETEWRGFVYGSAASANSGSYTSATGASSTRGLEASIMLIDAKTKDVVWAYEVHKSSHGALVLGTLATRGQQSLAEACAKHLKEFIEKNAKTGPYMTIAPIGQRSEDSNSLGTSQETEPPCPQWSQPAASLSAVSINSTPTGAEIFVDNEFAGNTPSILNISAGKHVITVKKFGFHQWVRKVNLYGGSITLDAELVSGVDGTHDAALDNEPAVASPTSSSINTVGWIGIHAENRGDVAVVTNVAANSPGAKAGIQVGDIILALDGRLLQGKNFDTAVAALKPETQISISFARGSSAHEVLVTVGSHN